MCTSLYIYFRHGFPEVLGNVPQDIGMCTFKRSPALFNYQSVIFLNLGSVNSALHVDTGELGTDSVWAPKDHAHHTRALERAGGTQNPQMPRTYPFLE